MRTPSECRTRTRCRETPAAARRSACKNGYATVISERRHRQQDRRPVERQHQKQRAEGQRGGDDERFPRRDLAARQRAIGGALDVRVEIAIGVVVDRAAGRAHQQRAEHEDADDDPRRRPERGEPQRGQRRPQQQQRADRLVEPDQPLVGVDPRGDRLPARRLAAPEPGPPSVIARPAAARAASSARAAQCRRAARRGVGNASRTRSSRFIRALESRLDSLMNESSIGAMRASASSHDTRGGRGRRNASATASNQPPMLAARHRR